VKLSSWRVILVSPGCYPVADTGGFWPAQWRGLISPTHNGPCYDVNWTKNMSGFKSVLNASLLAASACGWLLARV
jgi:hypothetical protein